MVMFKYADYFLLHVKCHEEAAELAIGWLTPSVCIRQQL